MLFKIVLDKQIRVFDCKETPSIALIHLFIKKSFPHLKNYSLYYLDDDQDQISLEADSDLSIYLHENPKKPKIFIQNLQSDAFDSTVKIELDKHEDVKVEVNESLDKKQEQERHQEEKEVQKFEQKLQKKEVEVQKVQENTLQDHPALCDQCGVDPIQGVRFKCAVCEDYDLCSQCQASKGHKHPLIKIRSSFQAPISCQLGLQEDPLEQERKRQMAERIKNSSIGKKEKLVYQSPIEREQIIISYLGNLLGEEEFSKYKEFSKTCKADTYEDLIEEYLHWLQEAKGGMEKVIAWIKKQFQAITKFKEQHFD